ncbi:MAG: hypothetical protein ACD_21C00308G0002 [uncultured bacterium]|nr:MAG: hypothetical protein ACD_21C00308G0002 [uncultured bacterium]
MNFSDYFSLQPLIEFFRAYPYSSGIITFFIVFLETLAVVGAVFPGAIIMPAIGFLIGTNVIPLGSTFLCAISGAIVGDYISYFIGIYFQGRIHRIWPFVRWPKLLAQGEKYFHAHGGKSVFIGRFVMVVRVVIPLIAGMLKMPFLRFSIAAIPSASIWAVGYIIPGVLLGALSLELPPKAAAEFTLWVFLSMIALWVIVWFAHHFFKQVWRAFDRCVTRMWKYCQKHKILRWITEVLADPRKPDNHQQLILAIAFILAFSLYFFTLYQVLTAGFFTDLDKPIYYLLRSLRVKSLDYISVVMTSLGDITMLTISSGLFLMWLLWKRYWYIAAHWFGVLILCAITIGGAKILVYIPRPIYEKSISSFTSIHALLSLIVDKYLSSFSIIHKALSMAFEKSTSSFPSAHTALSFVVYGFLAVIIARESKKQNRLNPYIISGVLVVLVAFSRLYLGVHWLTDVVGGVFIGLAIVLLATTSYRRRHHFHFSAREIFWVVISIFMATWFVCGILKFHKQVAEYSLIWPEQTTTLSRLPTTVPLYRLNRLGHAIEAFNVKWIGDVEVIKQNLVKQGWKVQPAKIDLLNIAKGFFDSAAIYHLPIFSQLYHNRPPVLLLTKDTGQDSVILALYLWESGIKLSDVNLPVWIGSVKYYQYNSSKVLSLDYFKHKPEFLGATEVFTKYLKTFHWKEKFYPQEQQPVEMTKLRWNGRMLVIYP